MVTLLADWCENSSTYLYFLHTLTGTGHYGNQQHIYGFLQNDKMAIVGEQRMTRPFLSIPSLQVKEKVRKSVYQGDILKPDVHHSTHSRHAQQIGQINQSYRNTVENISITFKTVKSVKPLLL